MASEPLKTLLRVRRLQVDEARRELGRQERYRHTLDTHILATEQALRNAMPSADSYRADVVQLEAFQRQGDRLRYQNQMLRMHAPQVQTQIEAAQGSLASARQAARAVEELVAARIRDRNAEALRRQQHELDDVARGLLLRQRVND